MWELESRMIESYQELFLPSNFLGQFFRWGWGVVTPRFFVYFILIEFWGVFELFNYFNYF